MKPFWQRHPMITGTLIGLGIVAFILLNVMFILWRSMGGKF